MAEYLIKEETLVAMGNNIRSHLNNEESRYGPKEMTTALDGSINHQTDLIAQIQAVVDNLPEAGSNEGDGDIGGNSEELEEMILNGDENYEDEGNQFYNVYKWIDLWNSNLSSAPVVISAINRHPTKWLHAYIRWTDQQGGYVNYSVIPIPPDDGENSIEIDIPVDKYVLEGVRWSDDGV